MVGVGDLADGPGEDADANVDGAGGGSGLALRGKRQSDGRQ